MRTSSCLFCAATLLASALLVLAPAHTAKAQGEEARALFEEGNDHLARGLRARGARRSRELGSALDAYLGVLRLGTRTRNVVFNVGLTLQELGRREEAFNYYSEYLRTFDLDESERAEGTRRIDSLRPQVAVIAVRSTPEGADVRVDRRDLPVRGQAPLELAVAAGERGLILSLEGYEDAEATVTAAVGSRVEAAVTLEAQPIAVQVIAPNTGELTLDGEAIEAGRSIGVAPGAHVVRLQIPGAPAVERHFEVAPGAEPLVLELTGSAAVASGPRLTVHVDRPADVFVDARHVGFGEQFIVESVPGPHQLRVEAPGRTTAHHAFTLSASEALALEVATGQASDHTGIEMSRGFFGFGALATGIPGAVLASVGFAMRDQRAAEVQAHNGGMPAPTAETLRRQANEINTMFLAADVLLGVTAALGVAAIVVLAIDPGEGEPATVEVAAAPTDGGGALVVRGSFGGAL